MPDRLARPLNLTSSLNRTVRKKNVPYHGTVRFKTKIEVRFAGTIRIKLLSTQYLCILYTFRTAIHGGAGDKAVKDLPNKPKMCVLYDVLDIRWFIWHYALNR